MTSQMILIIRITPGNHDRPVNRVLVSVIFDIRRNVICVSYIRCNIV